MGKFVTILIILYVLYYAGNIIYDLYIKKEKVEKVEEEVFSIDGLETQEDIKQVKIDDVENRNDVSSKEEELYEADYNGNDTPQFNMEALKRKHEEEREIAKKENPLKKIEPKDFQKLIHNASSKIRTEKEVDGYPIMNFA